MPIFERSRMSEHLRFRPFHELAATFISILRREYLLDRREGLVLEFQSCCPMPCSWRAIRLGRCSETWSTGSKRYRSQRSKDWSAAD